MRLADLPNSGPVTERQLAEGGIDDVETLRKVGVFEAYARLKRRFPGEIDIVALYALDGAPTDTRWNRLSPAHEAEPRRFAEEYARRSKRRDDRGRCRK